MLAHHPDLRHETIAARLGHQDLGARRIAPDLLAKAIHMGLQRVGGHSGIVAPHFVKKRVAPDRLIACAIEVFYYRRFFFFQSRLPAASLLFPYTALFR